MSYPKLSEDFLQSYKNVPVPFGPIGELVYYRTYARDLPNGKKETYSQNIVRCINALSEMSKGAFTMQELEELYDLHHRLKGSVSGRARWQLGTETVTRYGQASLNNCWFVVLDSAKAFCFLFDMLMLGGGVGYSVRKEDVYQLPQITRKRVKIENINDAGADFIVPDTREGWITLLHRVLNTYFGTIEDPISGFKGKSGFTYSTQLIRHAGQPIKGFGGVASGPEVLVEGIQKICGVLDARRGKRLRPIDCLDIATIIGSIVVAGNVRRSAELALGDADDFQFLEAKRWDLGTIPAHRAMSNNTVACTNIDHLPDAFWLGYEGRGEPYGLFNPTLVRSRGMLSDPRENLDMEACGTNPCGEISLESYEACNLNETFAPNLTSPEELQRVTELLFMASKVISTAPCHWEEADAVIRKNHRVGSSITGCMQRPAWMTGEVVYKAAKNIEKVDIEFSERLSKALGTNIAPSIKTRTIKPSGTLSLLAGVSPGVHPEFHKHYVRRVSISSSNPLVSAVKAAGYPTEYRIQIDGSTDYSTVVASFPIKARPGATADEVDAISQLQEVEFWQTYWSDNQVSCTVYFSPEELPEIKEYLRKNYATKVKSVSFLRKVDHGFLQAPISPITEKEYNEMVKNIKPIDYSVDTDDLYLAECAGACPVK